MEANTEQNIKNNNINQKEYNQQHISHPKVDLSKLDANEETMSNYTYPKEFLKLELDKIREFIDILEEHYQTLLDQENISLAKSVKQRLILLKNLEKEKMKKEAKIIYSNQRELVQDKMNEELNSYIETTNTEFDSLLHAFESQEVEILKTQKQELDEFKINFEKIYENKKPKPSKQILNWIKIRDYAIKQNKFDKVEEATNEINKLQKKNNEKFEIEKEKKLNIEMNKIIKRHDIEKNVLQIKKNNIIDMFNQTKNKNIEQIQKKYEAKMKELKNYQNFEMANFDKITKGIAKPSSRIQNIVNSTTDNLEDEKEEKDEKDENENENEIKGKEEYDEEEEIEEENKNENENENKNEENGEKQENINENENENIFERDNRETEEIQQTDKEEVNDGREEENENQGFEYEEHEDNGEYNEEGINEEYHQE